MVRILDAYAGMPGSYSSLSSESGALHWNKPPDASEVEVNDDDDDVEIIIYYKH